MDVAGSYIGLGERTRRVFIAFLISNFAFPVQVWLGIEYRKLSTEMDEIGRRANNAGFSVASRFFKVASTLCIALFAMGIAGIAASYISLYFEMFKLIQGMMQPAPPLSPGMFNFVYYLFPFVAVQSAIGIANCLVLRNAWRGARGAFRASTSPVVSRECVDKVDRVIKGLKWDLVANCLSVPIGVLLLVFFSMMGRFMPGGIVPSMFDLYTWLFVAILMLALALVAGIFGLLATINQGIGLFDLSKILQDRSKMAYGHPVSTGSDASGIPRAREPRDRCPSCGEPLPRVPSLRFCPVCGAKLQPNPGDPV
ncbi:MAG: zinc ribbon domain-containing protein [Candidatus Lokiarchaeota archaeon]|nr:zinc ribbon domain-containing protein [Candidatus Lokiarchaeota archaeon]